MTHPNASKLNAGKMFPIMAEDWRDERLGMVRFIHPGIPWSVIEPHREQAKHNHDQTLERLAERGGLSAGEAVCVLEDKPLTFGKFPPHHESLARLIQIVTERLLAQQPKDC